MKWSNLDHSLRIVGSRLEAAGAHALRGRKNMNTSSWCRGAFLISKEALCVATAVAAVVCVLIMSALHPVLARQADPADGVLIHNGFLTGQSFRDLPDLGKRSYVAGLIDGLFLAPLFDAPKSSMGWLESCVEGMTDEQVSAIISKYLDDNPGRWHQPVHGAAYSALLAACPGSPLQR